MSDTPIPIACTECSNQVARTYEQLRENAPLQCPACGHAMAAERVAVIHQIEAIRSAIATVDK